MKRIVSYRHQYIIVKQKKVWNNNLKGIKVLEPKNAKNDNVRKNCAPTANGKFNKHCFV
jgi:hypothetical protein